MLTGKLKDSIPPHNNDAEIATLGALLLKSESITTVLQYLRHSDFYKISHQNIFRCIIDLFNRGEAIDLITLSEEMRSQGLLDNSGGAGYISSLTSAVPTSANVEYYARIVQECSVRRNLLTISHDIIANAHDDGKETRYIIEEAERQIFEITDSHQTGGYKKASEIVGGTIDAIEKRYRTKDAYTGIPSGYSDLDVMLSGFQNSELIIIGARPSIGKTALALSMAANIAIHQNIATGFFTLEMSDMALMQRLVSSEARINAQTIRSGMLRPADFKSLMDAASVIYDAPLFIADTPNMKLLDLRAQARRMKSQHDIKIIFIDYITLITAENSDLPRHEQVAETSRSLKALARELEIPVVVLSQLKRETEGKKPNMADIRESGSIEQDADVIMFLHRDRGIEKKSEEDSNEIETELIVAKQRNGPIGTVKLAFIPRYTKFESLAEDF